MPIKIFKFNQDDEEKIQLVINDWEQQNKVKIDNLCCTPVKMYYNHSKTSLSDSDIMIIVNYHKRKLRKKQT